MVLKFCINFRNTPIFDSVKPQSKFFYIGPFSMDRTIPLEFAKEVGKGEWIKVERGKGERGKSRKRKEGGGRKGSCISKVVFEMVR